MEETLEMLEQLKTRINVLDRMHQVLSIGDACKQILNKQIEEIKEVIKELENGK